jgi:mono/diheme cytochrome c family protein
MFGHWRLAPGSRIGFATIVLSLAAPGMLAGAGDPPVEPDELRPGLVTIYRDTAKPTPAEFGQLEPTIALHWKANESAHPRLAADGGTVRWEGYINILRAGVYRFSARLRGTFRLRVDGKEMLAAEVQDLTPVLKEGPETRLEAGVYPLVADFTRFPGVARLEVMWRARFFATEPLARESLGHLPAKVPARLATDQLSERGRLLAEERNCVRCHQPADQDKMAKGLVWRRGPDLSQVGGRVHPGWIDQWLASPHQLRPGAVMPQMFTEDETGRVERHLVTRYLASLGGPMKTTKPPSPKDLRKSVANGERLFTSIGCGTCHGNEASKEPPIKQPRSFYGLGSSFGPRATVPLTGMGNKMPPEKLAAYLENPLAMDPSGRMPHLLLQGKEAHDLAFFLCQDKEAGFETGLPALPTMPQLIEVFRRVDSRPEEVAAFQRLPADKQILDLGQRLIIDKGCNQCHTIAPAGKEFAAVLASASFEDIQKPASQTRGCLADDRGQGGKAPWFGLAEGECKALRTFLQEGTKGAGSAAPAHAARVTIQRFNCLACHNRDGEGGLTPSLLDELRKFDKAENAEAVNPPPLTGVAQKLRTPWLKQVLTQAGRARPWMGLRMPQFGEANVGLLTDGLIALEGTEPETTVHHVPLTAAKLEAGRALMGKKAFGCISCHDIAGIANSGTRGPDLALMNQRVRFPWYRRWLVEAQRMQPGTRMPTVFPDGKSVLTEYLGGSAEAQAEAMWAYLSLGPSLPLPEGLEPPKGVVVQVKDCAVMIRTFMPEAGSHAIAVGYPGGMALAFDAATCRLAYAWSGNFLDASPVWGGRGGNPAKLLGTRFWTAPPGCPLAVTVSEGVPDFAARAADPAFGGAVPEGKLYEGPWQLQFEGYSPGKDGVPTFRYRLNAQELQPVEVQERPEPLRSPVGVGVGRRFTFTLTAQQKPWLCVGECSGPPRLLDGKGEVRPLDLKTGTAEVPVSDHWLALPQGGDKVVVLAPAAAPEGTRWHLSRHGNGWQVLLRLPPRAEAGTVTVGYNVWVPYRDDPELVKGLMSSK